MDNKQENMLPTFIVPYIIDEPERERTFTREMEKAAILCLAEAKRGKPGFLWGHSEEVEYIARFHYPLYGIPWKDKCIIIDGLGLSSATIIHEQIPNALEFTEGLEKSSSSFNLFRKSLKENSQIFRRFISMKEEAAEAVIGRGPVLRSLSEIVNQAERVNEESANEAFPVPPKFLKEEAERKAESFIGRWKRLRKEIDALQYALKALTEGTEHHKQKMSLEVEQMWGEYEDRISEMKRKADRKIKQLTEKKEKDTARAAKLHERRLKKALEEEGRLHRKIEQLELSLKEQRRKRKDQRWRYPKRSTTRIDSRIESYRKKIKELSKKLREFPKLKEEILRESEETFKMIEEKYLNIAAKEIEKLEILEQSRNLELSEKREQIKEIEEASSSIEAQIKRLIEQKNDSSKVLEAKTLPLKVNDTAIIAIPFYLVEYRSDRGTRTEICPPSAATSYDRMIVKIQRAILSFNLEARIQRLLNPRSKELNDEIFTPLKKSMDTDTALREAISEIAASRNLLKLPNFREEAAKGIRELEAEGWLNPGEGVRILSICSG